MIDVIVIIIVIMVTAAVGYTILSNMKVPFPRFEIYDTKIVPLTFGKDYLSQCVKIKSDLYGKLLLSKPNAVGQYILNLYKSSKCDGDISTQLLLYPNNFIGLADSAVALHIGNNGPSLVIRKSSHKIPLTFDTQTASSQCFKIPDGTYTKIKVIDADTVKVIRYKGADCKDTATPISVLPAKQNTYVGGLNGGFAVRSADVAIINPSYIPLPVDPGILPVVVPPPSPPSPPSPPVTTGGYVCTGAGLPSNPTFFTTLNSDGKYDGSFQCSKDAMTKAKDWAIVDGSCITGLTDSGKSGKTIYDSYAQCYNTISPPSS